MGMYDTVSFTNLKGEDVEVQIKMLDCILKDYKIGDSIELTDGIYFDWDCCFVVYNGIIVAGFDGDDNPLRSKRNSIIKMPDITV